VTKSGARGEDEQGHAAFIQNFEAEVRISNI
jgi:hypothetical protein